jgi:putative nucleotidyltransferase with HDIG domain
MCFENNNSETPYPFKTMDPSMEDGWLEKTFSKIKDLPTLPPVLVKLIGLINDPKSSSKELGKLVSVDQSQTARLLKVVNSPLYGFPRKISSVTEAITILGFDAVKNLALSISVFDIFGDSYGTKGFDRKKFWEHSIGCAAAGKVLAKYIGYPEQEELFVAGLLHDIGKVVLDNSFHKMFQQIIDLVQEKDILIRDAEREVLGFTHAPVGQELMKRWNLPSRLAEVIAYHHQPIKSRRFAKEAAVIHVADILCRALDLGSGGDNKIPEIDEKAWKKLKLKLGSLKSILRETEQEFTSSATIFMDT